MASLELLRNSRRNKALKGAAGDAWASACTNLGLTLQRNSASASGTLHGVPVALSLVGTGDQVRTMYTVELDAPSAPSFKLVPAQQDGQHVDLTFEGMVSIDTNNRRGMLDFLTTDRRRAIMDVLEQWSHTTMSNSALVVATDGVVADAEEIATSIAKLVKTANAMAPCWAEVQLDEASVLDDLFNSSRPAAATAKRFDDLYKLAAVEWCGEILQVGDIEPTGRRVVVFVGTSNGPVWSCNDEVGKIWAGRVVAMTTIDPSLSVTKGDVVCFDGALRHLDAEKRVFRIESFDTITPRIPLDV